jgi:predicted alpha/beta hydrolase family esterase
MTQQPLEYVFLAGIGNSEPDHWQSRWYRSCGARGHWVEHADWDAPLASAWLADLERLMRNMRGEKVLICHSLGCVLAASWLSQCQDGSCSAAFMVAVPDTEAASFPRQARGFPSLSALTPRGKLCLVSSRDDPYAGPELAASLGHRWNARVVDVGKKGHINLKSQLGDWDEGKLLLEELTGRQL